MSENELEYFLKLLSSSSGGGDGQELYLQLFYKLVGLLTILGVSDAEEATAVTIDVAARRILAGAPVPNVEKYCKGIARNIAKEILRKERREDSAFIKFIENSHDGPTRNVARVEEILGPCFELLCREDQELLREYCSDVPGLSHSEHRREMAAKRSMTVAALRMLVSRVRKDLKDCAKKRSKDLEG